MVAIVDYGVGNLFSLQCSLNAIGAEITVTEDTVLYADWVASTYDIGVYNSYVANTVSTNDFITTHVFDYDILFNIMG